MKLAPICRDHVGQFMPLGDEGKQLASCVRIRDLASRLVAIARVSSAIFRTQAFLEIHYRSVLSSESGQP
jgi:hypothetical protein